MSNEPLDKSPADLGVFSDDLAYGHVVFVVAKRPVDKLEVEFKGFEVNGTPVPLNYPGKLPSDQGYWIDVGAFPVGQEIEICWKIHTGIEVPEGNDVLFGHCPNGKLTKLVRLERHPVERFKDYSGCFKVTPERP